MADRQCVQRAQAGEHAAFTALVTAYRQMVYGICYRMTGHAEDAEDLAHETFVEAFLKLPTLQDPDAFGAWLRTLTLNLCRMWLRGRLLDTEELTEAIPARPPEEDDPLFARISHGLMHLSPPLRVTLVLHYLEGLSYHDIATFLDVPIGTVMSRLHRGRKELKQVVEDTTDEEIPMMPDENFTQEIEAEIRVLLAIFREDPTAAERLSVLLIHAPKRLAQVIATTDDDDTLQKLSLLLHRLGRPGIELVVNSAVTEEKPVREQALRLLRYFIAPRVTSKRQAGFAPDWIGVSPEEAYLLADGIIRSTASPASKAEVLADLIEAGVYSATTQLLTDILLCDPEAALPALLARFRQAAEMPGQAVSVPVMAALSRLGTRFVAAILATFAQDNTAQQLIALNGLEAFARALATRQQQTTRIARRSLGKWGPIPPEEVDAAVIEQAATQMAALLDDPHVKIRARAIRVLGLLKRAEYRERLETLALHDDPAIRLAALHALAEMGLPDSIPTLSTVAVRGSEVSARVAAIEALGRMGAAATLPLLADLLADPDTRVRQVAATALGDIGGDAAREALLRAKLSTDKALARTSAKVLHTSPHFQSRPKPEVALQQLHQQVRERLIGDDACPDTFISVHAAISMLPAIRPYPERELTRYIARACHDYSTTRRMLIMEKLMRREAGIYELTDLGQAIWRVEHFIQA